MHDDATSRRSLRAHLLGVVDFDAFLALQRYLTYELSDPAASPSGEGRQAGGGVVLCAQHPPLITIGAEGSCRELPPEDVTRPAVRWVSRGGGAVLHGPGQLSLALLLPVERWQLGTGDLRELVHDAAIAAVAELGVAVHTRRDRSGLFTQQGQVGVFGMAVEHGVSSFGLFFNVVDSPLLRGFVGRPPRPSGRADTDSPVGITSLEAVRMGRVEGGTLRAALIRHVAARLQAEVRLFTGHEQLARQSSRPAAQPPVASVTFGRGR